MDSSALFLVPDDKREELDFRWFSSDGRTPVSDGAVYAGLVRGAAGRAAAEAFLRWFLTPEAQRAVLERSRQTKAMENAFGIAGGFSSLRSVNEGILPGFYPVLLGHAPPAGTLRGPAPLPDDWPALRDTVIAPWALEASALAPNPASGARLAERLAEYRSRSVR
jgi:ABC-type glycerol-3-phosphate transport system substrate-binding protein